MKLEGPEAFRFILFTLSGLLIVGSTTTWHSVGYLNIFGWFIEWSDIILSFLCIFLASGTNRYYSNYWLYLFFTVCIVFVLASLHFVSRLQVFNTPNSLYYIVLAIPVILFALTTLNRNSKPNFLRRTSLIFFLTALSSMMFIVFLFYKYSIRFPTDESVIDLYSAHLFLQGMNPYNPALVSGAFSFYNFPVYATTPLTTGGFVHYLTYPAFSFLVMVPTAIFGTKSSLEMIPFFAIPIFLAWYRAWSRKEWAHSFLIIFPFLGLSIYTSQVEFADLNIVWVVLVMISYYVLPRTKLSGFIFGMALSVKQFPVIVVPFMLYYVYREYGRNKTVNWFLLLVAAFLLINGYFMIIGFKLFLSSIVANETAHLLGVGFGVSQISFLGFVNLPSEYFTFIMLGLSIFFLALYVLKFDSLKFALFSFPIIIFLFNYRLFVQYVMYWLVISLLPLLDLLHSKKEFEKYEETSKDIRLTQRNQSTKAYIAIILAILIISVSIAIPYTTIKHEGRFEIDSISVDAYNSTGYINQISVNVTFQGKSFSNSPILFRFVLPEPITNVNMYLWSTVSNVTLQSGEMKTVAIVPLFSIDPIPQNTSFKLLAYYGGITGSYSGKI